MDTTQLPTAFVIDDDEAARLSVCALATSMHIPAEGFASVEEFLASFDPSRPGCIVADLRMPGASGVDLLAMLAERGAQIPVIIVTAFATTPLTVKAMKGGAVTFLEKPCGNHELTDAIREALARDAAAREAEQSQREIQNRLARLTAEEQQVLGMLVEGKPNKLIAKQLDVSLRTIESRRHNIFSKTNTSTVAELVRLVMRAKEE
jgi:two-component system, LuxR family, response regulator FixJ